MFDEVIIFLCKFIALVLLSTFAIGLVGIICEGIYYTIKEFIDD